MGCSDAYLCSFLNAPLKLKKLEATTILTEGERGDLQFDRNGQGQRPGAGYVSAVVVQYIA